MGDVETTLTAPAVSMRARLEAAERWPGAAIAATGAVVVVAGVSAAVRIYLTREVSSPFVFMDELGYERMAQSFAHTGQFSLFGSEGLAYSPLYPVVISPIYAVTSSAQVAYEWARVLNVLFFSLAVLPLYAIARSVLTRTRAVGVCALSSLLPLMFYANLEMSEGLAYLTFLFATWSIVRAIRRPSVRNDLMMAATVVLAAGVRLQNVALLPAALTAIAIVALAATPREGTRLQAIRSAIQEHWLAYGSSLAFVVFVLVKRATNGGSLPLAGRYAEVGTAHATPGHVLVLSFQHFVELDLALGVVPFAGAILAGYAVARFGFPKPQLVFAAVAVSVTAWLVLEVAYDAAAFDHEGLSRTLPRIHERYLIYLQPLFLIAFVAALRAVRPRVSWHAHLVIAAAAALLPATIPFAHVVNFTVPIDTFGLEVFATSVHGETGPVPHPAIVAMCIGAFFALAYLYALLRPRPSFAVIMTVFALVLMSLVVQLRMRATSQDIAAKYPPENGAWVDRAVHRQGVTLVGGIQKDSPALLLAAFRNLSVTRVYSTCVDVFRADFGERRLSDVDGTLQDGATPLRARYVLAPVHLRIRGRVVGRRPKEGLELVKPSGGVVRIARPLRCPAA
jgi:hypothetical protein